MLLLERDRTRIEVICTQIKVPNEWKPLDEHEERGAERAKDSPGRNGVVDAVDGRTVRWLSRSAFANKHIPCLITINKANE